MDTKKILIGAASLAVLGSIAIAGPAAADGNGQRTIKAEGFRVQTDIGSCNNEWATVSLDKAYKLTLVTDGMYNLEVKEEGPLTTLPGKSPGACESGTDNGHTVAAGITGRTHQEFNATVKSAVAPNRHPDCGVSGCAGSGDFLDAVFGAGVGNYTRDAWSWTAHYQTRSNGTYFDRSVDWPLNNRGDITGDLSHPRHGDHEDLS
jgi:hypothetical protein